MSTNQDSQARQLESAKTFTEQYSLPDDITITPIIVNNASALLLKNTSISIVNPPTSSPKSASNTPQGKQGGSPVNKRKERDIVHVIDPRSGHKTTIAKHISNRNLLVKSNVNKQQPKASPRPNMKKLGAVGVGKLNPDLDVIVINNNNGNADCDDSITENIAHNTQRGKKSPQQQLMNTTKLNKKSINAGMVTSTSLLPAHSIGINRGGKSNVGNKRVVVTVNENGKSSGGVRNSIQNSPVNYSLPPGISVSSGSPNYNRSQAVHNSRDPNNFVHIQTFDQKGKKRISLNECIDGLQKKRLKLLEEHNVDGTIANVNGNVNVIPRTPAQLPSKFNNGGRLPSRTAGSISSYSSGTSTGKFSDSSYSSARVRDSQILRGCTVIQSCDAEVAVSAVVLDHESYIRKNLRLSPKGLKIKNGLNKGNNNKFHSSSSKNRLFLPQQQQRELNYVVGMSKVKSSNNNNKGMGMGGGSSQRNTRSAAANAKIRTRFSANKPRGGGGGGGDSSPPRSRSRLLRGAGGSSGAGNQRGDSDSSNNNSRSNSAVRIINGHSSSSSGGMGRGVVDRESKKFPTQAFINAVADLYQYRRNVLLRVPRSGVGVFPSASSINLSTLNPPPKNNSSSPGDKETSQLSPSIPSQNEHVVVSSFSASVATVGLSGPAMKQPVGSMAANAAKKRAAMKPLSPAAINGALLQMGLAMRRTPKWSNGWRFEGEPYDIKVYLNVSLYLNYI
jgi:hypothetical protein